METTWNYLQTEYRAERISGGYGIMAGCHLVFSAYTMAEVMRVAREKFGYR